MHIHRRLFGFAANVHGFFGILSILSLSLVVVIIVQMLLLSIIIADVFVQVTYPNPHHLILLLLAILARSALVWIRELYAHKKTATIKSKIREKGFEKVVEGGPAFTRAAQTGSVINTLTEGIEKLDDYFTRYIPSLIHIMILPITIIAFVFYLDWPSGIILSVTGPLIVFFMWLIGTYAKKISMDQWRSLGVLSSRFLDAIEGLKTLKLFGRDLEETREIERSSEGFRLMTMKVLTIAFLSGMVLELAASISIALVAVQVGIRLIEGMMEYQPGLFVLLLAPEFYLPFRALGQHHHAGMEGSAAAAEIFEIIDKPVGKKLNLQQLIEGQTISISCNNLCYAYPGSQQPAIHNLNCEFIAGELTAIVGKTGSGKSTLIQMILGYIKPDSGSLLANGKSLLEADPDAWRKNIAFVSQHPWFFNGTIKENLLMANPAASEKEINESLERVNLLKLIEKLPHKLDTLLTENASRLSGGEKQRLAIARAFLKNAPLFILDEPTSSLDPESEQIITTATRFISENKTTIIIAHRLKTVRNAHKILVFDKGNVAESGNHQQLVSQRGIYYGYLSALGNLEKDNL